MFKAEWGNGIENNFNALRMDAEFLGSRSDQTHRAIAVNLGRGEGTSVLQLIRAFEQASGRKVPFRIADRRR